MFLKRNSIRTRLIPVYRWQSRLWCTNGFLHRFFALPGIQTYGFTPIDLPKDFPITELIHGAGERIPPDALRFDTEVIYEMLKTL
jgi:acetylornithine deacetylase/succinyl-diaminopimelate desuccinylase-like protein